MSTTKRNFLIILALSLVYFVLFVPPNLKGARDREMLSVFEVDEHTQFKFTLQMLAPADTFTGTLKNFIFYKHLCVWFSFLRDISPNNCTCAISF